MAIRKHTDTEYSSRRHFFPPTASNEQHPDAGVGGQDERFDQAKLSRLLGGCAACVLLSRKPPVWMQMKEKPESWQSPVFIQLVGHKCPDFPALCLLSLHLTFAYCNSLFGLFSFLSIFFFFFCQGQRLGCQNRLCTVGVTNIYAVSATMTILALWCRGFNFWSWDCVSHQSLLQTKHLLIIINKRCGRLRLCALYSVQVGFLLVFFPVLTFFLAHAIHHRMRRTAKKQSQQKKRFGVGVFVQAACTKISGWGLSWKSRHHQKSLRRPQSSSWAQRKHTPVYMHAGANACERDAFKVNMPYNLNDRSIRA